MKLLKKLLPIATVASVATVVTPLTVSCGKGISNNFDYYPTITPHEGEYFDEADMDDYQEEIENYVKSIYFSDVEENKDILVQDAFFYCAQHQKQYKADQEDDGGIVDKWNFNLSIDNLKVEEVTIKNESGVFETHYLLSFDAKGSRHSSVRFIETGAGYKETITKKYDLDITIKVNKIEYWVDYVGGYEEYTSWWITPKDNLSEAFIPDDARIEVKGTEVYTNIVENKYGKQEEKDGGEIGGVADKDHDIEEDLWDIITHYIYFESFYLQNFWVIEED